jgi:two-component system, NarL family, sensor histidine kinase DesK
MIWLATVIRVAIAPVFLGALFLLVERQRSARDLAAAAGLVLLGAIHVLYWWRPWPSRQRRAVVVAGGMVLTNLVLLDLLGLTQPLLWLYPALIVGAGLPAPAAVVGVALTALAAAAPMARSGTIVGTGLAPDPFGASHSILLSIALAGLGMVAVRQLIGRNTDLHAARAELADLAVARDRERLALELHDLLGRTLSLIAVKAELASRLSSKGDPSAEAELGDVQRLARQAVRDVREAVAGAYAPSVAAELSAAEMALRTAGIELSIDTTTMSVHPMHETAVAWVLREAVTNVVKHSGARTCRIALDIADGSTLLEIEDDGRGPIGGGTGAGLDGLANRIQALGGSVETGPSDGCGFRLRVRLGAATPPGGHPGAAR